MSEANALLESLSGDEMEKYSVEPINDILYIDAENRTIIVPGTEILLGVETDQDVERKYFKCPRIVGDNVDLSTLSLRVPFRNANGDEDEYIVEDLSIDRDYVTFSWLLSEKVLKYKGVVYFTICAVKAEADGTLKNVWNTTLASGNVLEGLSVTKIDEYEEEQARDVLVQLISMLEKQADTSIQEVKDTGSEQIKNIQEEGTQQLEYIESKGSEVLATIPEDYQTTYDYAEEGSRTKSDAVTNTLTGEVITANDCSDDYLRGVRIFGKSVQEPTTGAQLFNASAIGVNLYTSVDAEDVIRIDCDNTEGTGAKFATFYNPVTDLLKTSTQYAMVLEVLSINEPSAVVYLASHYSAELSQFNDTPTVTNLAVGTYVKLATTAASFTDCAYMCRGFVNIPAGKHVQMAIRVSVYADTTVTADTFKYERFTGGIAGPNPQYPIPIVGTGQRYVSGANLFKISDKTFELDGTKWTVKNGVVRIKGTSGTTLSSGNYIRQDFVGQAGTFTISGSTQYTSVYLNVIGSDGVEHWYNQGTVTLDGKESKALAYLQINRPNATIDDVIYPMINRNSTTMPWEPWTDTKKKVVDLDFNVDLLGKNFLKNNIRTATNAGVTYTQNVDGSVTITGTPTAISYYTFSFYDEIPVYDTDITMSLGANNGKITLVAGYIKSDGTVVNDIAHVVDGEVTFRYPREAYKTRTFLTVSTGVTFDNFVVYPMMRIAGTDNKFEIYIKPQSLLISDIDLSGIEVFDESMATYTDSDGKMYYSNELKEKSDSLIHTGRIKVVEFDGSDDENWVLGYSSDGVNNRFQIMLSNTYLLNKIAAGNNGAVVAVNALCSHFGYQDTSQLPDTNKFRVSHSVTAESNIWYMLFNPDTSVVALEDLDAWKAWLAENPITIMLPSEVFTAMDRSYSFTMDEGMVMTEELELFRETRTNKYNTTVLNGAGTTMEMTYNRDTESYLKGLFDSIVNGSEVEW